LIGADPNYFLQHTLDHWSGDSHAIQAEARAEYERCFTDPEVIHATCEDYRAGATIDVDHDKTDHARRKIECPTLVLWAERDPAERLWDTLAVWRGWAHDVLGAPLRCGHFLPEEAPEETAAALLDFLAPWGVSREGYS
jgi:haloacetate dehalogenase